jgi:hypothetical protein
MPPLLERNRAEGRLQVARPANLVPPKEELLGFSWVLFFVLAPPSERPSSPNLTDFCHHPIIDGTSGS